MRLGTQAAERGPGQGGQRQGHGVHRLADNLYTAIGFSGRGVPTATAVGRDIATMLISGDEDAMALPLTLLPWAPFSRLGSSLIANILLPAKRILGKLS